MATDTKSRYPKITDSNIDIDYLRITKVMELTNILSPKTIYNYKEKGLIQFFKYKNKNYVYKGDIDIIKKEIKQNKSADKENKDNEEEGYSNLVEEGVMSKNIVDTEDIQSKNDVSTKRVEELEEEINRLNIIIQDYNRENTDLKKQVKNLNNISKENLSLKEQIKELNDNHTKDVKNIKRLTDTTIDLSKEVVSYKEIINALKTNAEELTTIKDNLFKQVNKLQDALQKANNTISMQNATLAELGVYKRSYIKILAHTAELHKEIRELHLRQEEILQDTNKDLSVKLDKVLKQAEQYQVLLLDKVESKRTVKNKENEENKEKCDDKKKRYWFWSK